MKVLILLLLFCCEYALADGMPLNPNVTQDTIDQTICVHNWTATVRPPVSYTNKIKYFLLDVVNLAHAIAGHYELDHHIPIELGGSPDSKENLRLQYWHEADAMADFKVGTIGEVPVSIDGNAHTKDALENKLKRLVCTHQMPLADAQACIWNDWRSCLIKVGGDQKSVPID